MGMIEDIFAEYVRMRENGLEAKEALRALRNYIEPIPSGDKEYLAQQLRAWERGRSANPILSEAGVETQPPPPSLPMSFKPRAVTDELPDPPLPPNPPKGAPPTPMRQMAAIDIPEPPIDDLIQWLACPHCGATNRTKDVFCYSCGQILQSSQHDTRTFADATDRMHRADYFGSDSVLRLTVRDTSQVFELRPQSRNHELVIGRSADNMAMNPDVDLTHVNGAKLGVSRLHLALRYSAEDKALQMYDLGSSNGSYVNGQRLHPRENRILRSGDELRLGRMVLSVVFLHPGEEIKRR